MPAPLEKQTSFYVPTTVDNKLEWSGVGGRARSIGSARIMANMKNVVADNGRLS